MTSREIFNKMLFSAKEIRRWKSGAYNKEKRYRLILALMIEDAHKQVDCYYDIDFENVDTIRKGGQIERYTIAFRDMMTALSVNMGLKEYETDAIFRSILGKGSVFRNVGWKTNVPGSSPYFEGNKTHPSR
jgi:hypothetical protein